MINLSIVPDIISYLTDISLSGQLLCLTPTSSWAAVSVLLFFIVVPLQSPRITTIYILLHREHNCEYGNAYTSRDCSAWFVFFRTFQFTPSEKNRHCDYEFFSQWRETVEKWKFHWRRIRGRMSKLRQPFAARLCRTCLLLSLQFSVYEYELVRREQLDNAIIICRRDRTLSAWNIISLAHYRLFSVQEYPTRSRRSGTNCGTTA